MESVLKKAAYIGDGSIVLAVRDPQIPENGRTFAVRFAQGKAVSVEEASEEADAVLTIQAFSALITGVCDLREAALWMDGLAAFFRTLSTLITRAIPAGWRKPEAASMDHSGNRYCMASEAGG